jgi:hypothetical protein
MPFSRYLFMVTLMASTIMIHFDKTGSLTRCIHDDMKFSRKLDAGAHEVDVVRDGGRTTQTYIGAEILTKRSVSWPVDWELGCLERDLETVELCVCDVAFGDEKIRIRPVNIINYSALHMKPESSQKKIFFVLTK